ncbi:DUF72 domain-containing protein [Sporolactobacillus vineae]|uniref:DUF72 domain-containing protein n=1 Tax=Sporolactobacillus vineae TaxID=444463 RepID=UPI000288BB54|nr:DUF72 domain-containing protein [Sporolactobacillus vineae]
MITIGLTGWGDSVLIRLHGRNTAGWLNHGPNWQAVRCLYRYSAEEMDQLAGYVAALARRVQNSCILFNNNSGGAAADNARQLIGLLGLHYSGLASRQIDLF